MDKARTIITTLVRSNRRAERELACQAIPYLAAKDPETGFPLWRELADSSRILNEELDRRDVTEAAAQALIDTVGVLNLDPEGVVEVMRASLRWRHEVPNAGYHQ